MSSEPRPIDSQPPVQEPPKAPGLLRSSGVVGVMTMLSRVLGLVRDMVIARYFGAGTAADAFFVAFKIPNFLRRLFAEGAFSQAFVPVLSSYGKNATSPRSSAWWMRWLALLAWCCWRLRW
jgi:putative peptidoglycan lipid II flippase